MPENTLFTYRTEEDPEVLRDTRVPTGMQGSKVAIDSFWNGDSAFAVKGPTWANLTQVYSVWTQAALFFYFECWFGTSFGDNACSHDKDIDAEYVSVLLRPGGCEGCFEISVDTAGHKASRYLPSPSSGLRWDPNLEFGVKFSQTERIWRMFLEVPYATLLAAENAIGVPEIGDAWRLNLYRTAFWKGEREQLSWQATYKGDPTSFLFGHLIFLGALT
jgi:hypothetical protein